MKNLLLVAFLTLSFNAFSYITIIRDEEIAGSKGWMRVVENFSTDGPGNCIFELTCSEPGNMTCSFTVLNPDNTPGCLKIVVNTDSSGSGNAYNDVCSLVDSQISLGNVSGIIQPGNISVVNNGINESAVIAFTVTLNTVSNKRYSEIKVYSLTEAQNLGII